MKLKIYMKSGNVIPLFGIKNYNFQYRGNTIVGVELHVRRWSRARLIIGTIDMSQIEAVVRS